MAYYIPHLKNWGDTSPTKFCPCQHQIHFSILKVGDKVLFRADTKLQVVSTTKEKMYESILQSELAETSVAQKRI